eukprot:gene37742-65120_t
MVHPHARRLVPRPLTDLWLGFTPASTTLRQWEWGLRFEGTSMVGFGNVGVVPLWVTGVLSPVLERVRPSAYPKAGERVILEYVVHASSTSAGPDERWVFVESGATELGSLSGDAWSEGVQWATGVTAGGELSSPTACELVPGNATGGEVGLRGRYGDEPAAKGEWLGEGHVWACNVTAVTYHPGVGAPIAVSFVPKNDTVGELNMTVRFTASAFADH